MSTPSTSSTVWLTKAVDTAVSLLVHVVVYTVPACPADALMANIYSMRDGIADALITLTHSAIYYANA